MVETKFECGKVHYNHSHEMVLYTNIFWEKSSCIYIYLYIYDSCQKRCVAFRHLWNIREMCAMIIINIRVNVSSLMRHCKCCEQYFIAVLSTIVYMQNQHTVQHTTVHPLGPLLIGSSLVSTFINSSYFLYCHGRSKRLWTFPDNFIAKCPLFGAQHDRLHVLTDFQQTILCIHATPYYTMCQLDWEQLVSV